MSNIKKMSDARTALEVLAECFATAPCKEQDGSFHITGSQLTFLKSIIDEHIKSLAKVVEANASTAKGQGSHDPEIYHLLAPSIQTKLDILMTTREDGRRTLEDPATPNYVRNVLIRKQKKLDDEINVLKSIKES